MNHQRIIIVTAFTVSCTASFFLSHAWPSSKSSSGADQPNGLKSPRALHAELQSSSDSGHSSASQASQSVHGFAKTDHTAQSILSNSNAVTRAKTWARFVDSLDASNCQVAANGLLQGGYFESRKHELSILVSEWANQDPLSALEFAEVQDVLIGIDTLGSGTSLHEAALASWATTDPEAAIEYVNNKYESGSVEMCGVIKGLAGKDLARANELLAGMPPSHERCKAMQALISHYLAKGAEAARSWAMGMEDPTLRRDAIGEVSSALAKSDPQGAIDWLWSNADSASSYAIRVANVESAVARLGLTGLYSMSEAIYIEKHESEWPYIRPTPWHEMLYYVQQHEDDYLQYEFDVQQYELKLMDGSILQLDIE